MFEWQKEIRDGMLLMVSQNRGYIEATHNILRYVHEIYIENNSHLYTESELYWITHYLDSVVYKYFLLRLAVEQLQSVRHGRIYESLWPAIENSVQTLDCSDDEQILVSFALEAFLFEARSFLDIYMILVCLLLKTGFTKGHMSKSTFFSELDKVTIPPFAQKADWMKQYFEKKVFGHEENPGATVSRNDWGTLLRSLRDRIAHRDIITLSFDSQERFTNDIRLDWPTLKGITYHLFAETIGNEVHALFHQALCHIYELKWDDYQAVAQEAV
ncbi:MAG: hypothetical protein M9941_00225 [Anaerolineae bacterium]|nr:hypothetical protein [Anaerolineae bacterium]MCO5191071.1 hypothetical protein [Anaerolineae bacterium]MCO5193260.1 hypothetical protein [Anaerolineae bacterium]MCO5196182.1 hypothetical protein [Anaerolineae bacterium]